MKKQLIGIAVIAGLIVGTAGIGFAHRDDDETKLVLEDATGTGASGEAELKAKTTKDGFDKISIEVKVKDLMAADKYVFEGWLVDKNTGYKLSIGGFSTDAGGEGKLKFKQKLVNFALYDVLVITTEPIGDENPNPDTMVLSVALH